MYSYPSMGGINIGVILLLPSAVLVSICLLIGARWGMGGAGRRVCSLQKKDYTNIKFNSHKLD